MPIEKECSTPLSPDSRECDISLSTGTPQLIAPWLGKELDHFRIERYLGEGGMGQVFAGTDQSLDRPVAIKIIKEGLSDARFLAEARAQAKLNHPNVVHIHYIGRHEIATKKTPRWYFAMELVEGESLDEMLKRGEKLKIEQAREDMLSVARALREAHRAGFMHRDIKPSNLLRDHNGYLKVADFGLVKAINEINPAIEATDNKQTRSHPQCAEITQSEHILGSPLYMSPEQANALPVDARSDMFSLGACFYHLITGIPPFELDATNKPIYNARKPIEHVRRNVNPKLAIIVHKLLHPNTDNRYTSYDEIIEDLKHAAPQRVNYAGLWTRIAAFAIDSAVAAGLLVFIGSPAIILWLISLALGDAIWGQSIGKYIFNIQVRRLRGTLPGIPRSLARTLTTFWMPLAVTSTFVWAEGHRQLVNTVEKLQPAELDQLQQLAIAFGISHGVLSLLYAAGLALAVIHPQKRTLHDLVTDTIVIYRLDDKNAPMQIEAPRRSLRPPASQ